jgi:hypothetical protein
MNPIKDQKAYIIYLISDSRRVSAVRDLLVNQDCKVRHQAVTTSASTTEVERFQQGILQPQIEWADVLVVLISVSTKNDPVIAWAVQCALSLGKRVVGIWDEEETDGTVPGVLDDYANAVVPPDPKLVLDAVGGGIDGVRGPDGKSRIDRVIERHDC